ncbi:hypothetical protein AB0M47_02205 [Hamadaea sp. NPDC051192]|uniref:hypothetical protein n=1 Tax=Hamadaea sp. NPDC051192 TaxID=3154940 RepID=UPI003438A7C8
MTFTENEDTAQSPHFWSKRYFGSAVTGPTITGRVVSARWVVDDARGLVEIAEGFVLDVGRVVGRPDGVVDGVGSGATGDGDESGVTVVDGPGSDAEAAGLHAARPSVIAAPTSTRPQRRGAETMKTNLHQDE